MDSRRIQEITAKGIRYLDDEGQEQFIDFQICFDNYLQERLKPEHLARIKQINNFDDESLQSYIEARKEWKQVAVRDITGEPFPYMKFHTNPAMSFYFATVDEFQEVQHKILKAGWRTFDLS